MAYLVWELGKQILLHFIRRVQLAEFEKPRRSFILGWEAENVFYIVFLRVLVGLRSQEDLSVTLSWEVEKTC